MQWMNVVELMEEVAKQGLKVAGMTPAEAANALGFTQLANGTFVKNVINSSAGKILEFPGTTAAAAAAEAGGLVSEAASSTTANLALVETAGGSAGTAGILSIAVPIAASLLAAVGGYLVGNSLYENNQDFFDGISGPLMKYAADGTVNLMGLMDSMGNTYLDKRAYDGVKNYLDSFIPSGVDYVWNSTNARSAKPVSSTQFGFNRTAMKYAADGTVQFNKFTKAGYLSSIDYLGKWVDSNFPGCISCIDAFSHNFDDLFDIRYLNWGAMGYVKVLTKYTSSTLVNRSDNDTYKLLNVSGSYSMYRFTIVGESPTNSAVALLTTLPGGNGFANFYLCMEIAPAYTCTGSFSIDPSFKNAYSNISSAKESTLPNGISKYTPKAATLTDILLHTTVDGCPQELPYIPVRFPTSPDVIPFPDPNINPNQPEPNEEPSKKPNITPFITPNPAYPEKIPKPPKKPLPTPDKNPDKKPCVLPDPVSPTKPKVKPDVDPNPALDPSVKPAPNPEPVPEVPVDPDPAIDPDDIHVVPTPIIPVIPPISGAAAGLLHVYNPTSAQITQFGSWLWTTFSGDIIDTISKLFNNPMDAVIGLHEIYATPSTGDNATIRAGYLDSQVASRLVNKRYTSINCGSVVIQEYWGNYLDYSPYTKTYCYLPFIGIVELQTDDIIAHAVNITYKVDSYTGACIAIITVAKSGYESVPYQFSGNCSVELPITSGMNATIQNALIGAATAGLVAVSGGAGAAALGSAAVGGARRGMNSKNDVQHSGSFGSNFGAMGIKKPFIIVKRPKQKVVANYNVNYGYPAHKMVTISECSGYTRVREVDVISVTATEEEKKLIETMLKEGIYV